MMHKCCHFLIAFCLPAMTVSAQQELQQNNLTDSNTVYTSNWVMPTALPDNGTISGNHAEKNIRFRSSIRKGKLHGEWSSWYEDGMYHDQGQFKNGLPDGAWKVWYSNGQVQFVRHFSADNYIRVQQEWLRPHPKMVQTPLGALHKTNKALAQLQLTWAAIFDPKNSSENYYPVFRNGLLHGLYINYFDNGVLKDSGIYRNGLREGIWIHHRKGTDGYEKGWYRNGKKEGVWKYTIINKTSEIIHFKNDRIVFKKTY